MSIQRTNPTNLWSDITVHNGVAYFVEVPETDLDADIRGQVQQVWLGFLDGELKRRFAAFFEESRYRPNSDGR